MINIDKTEAKKNPDMSDTDDELKKFPHLKNALTICNDKIYDQYCKADDEAESNQSVHKILTMLVAVFGTLAVLCAIVQLSEFFVAPWPMRIEVITAIIAFFAVLFGIWRGLDTGWLLERHKAERFRALKFCSIIEPDLWRSDGTSNNRWEEQLRVNVNDINGLTFKKMKDTSFKTPDDILKCSININSKACNELIDYYKKYRIDVQTEFFKKRIESKEQIDKKIKHMPPVFFFLSILAEFGHFVIALLFHDLHTIGLLLIVLAASFPIVGAGVRLFRSAFEFARSVSLYHSKYTALILLDEKLKGFCDEEVKESERNAEEILLTMWQCEQILDEEHSSWVRLMNEAEWYG